MPAWLGGIVLGAMLINVLGAASGLSLGAATIVVRDVVENLRTFIASKVKTAPAHSQLSTLTQTRLSIVAILAIAVLVANLFNGAFINDLGFLSLGLRAVALLFPLSFALWMPGRFNARAVLLSMPIGTAAMLLGKAFDLPGDPVYYGLAASLIVILSHRRNIIKTD
jgi:SSS family solute:Na+ symporter